LGVNHGNHPSIKKLYVWHWKSGETITQCPSGLQPGSPASVQYIQALLAILLGNSVGSTPTACMVSSVGKSAIWAQTGPPLFGAVSIGSIFWPLTVIVMTGSWVSMVDCCREAPEGWGGGRRHHHSSNSARASAIPPSTASASWRISPARARPRSIDSE